ncbi:phenylalanine--tRNA ligase subunit alpha [candidate division WOR-3 bacterium]|uniref:Phenylalanine--tRNA ligase alpha subunit n=1 Tax=candidate division WOR-3 bacterium TaxID=2052148 RepID=A0A660SNH1_UNCW3|nr:MAG: phenylalanine--tRNA ligase subunit alpha [candidate division WOR-3 bacterium]
MLEELKRFEAEVDTALKGVKDPEGLEQLRLRFLGRKGRINEFFKRLGRLPVEERPKVGKILNQLKARIESTIASRRSELKEQEVPRIDLTLPGRMGWVGHPNPLSLVIDEIIDFFVGLGFTVEFGPEIETDWYNFEALNIPPYHPSREMFSSFYLGDELLLRSHTSPVQIRVMERKGVPIRFIAPGPVYRVDKFDATHSPFFYQIEGLYVDQEVSFAELKGDLEAFAKHIFGESVRVRFFPSYFPFTEPSAEMSISCPICQGKGCRVCGDSGWLEILGCGMVHPNVFKSVGIDPDRYQGYAFGLGAERIAMIKYIIGDIRLFYENDFRFLDQFR